MSIDSLKIGSNIRTLRRRRHLTQRELAERIGIKPGPLCNLEQGHNLPSASVLAKLSAVLDVPIDALFASSIDFVANERTMLSSKGAVSAYIVDPAAPGLGVCSAMLARTAAEASEIKPAVVRRLGLIADTVLALEDICGAQKVSDLPLQAPFDCNEPGLKALSDRVRRYIGVNEAVIFDYLELFENAGMRIVFCRFPLALESLGAYDAVNRNVFIFIRHDLSAERSLFRLVYELGRIYLFNRKDIGPGAARASASSESASSESDAAQTDDFDYRGKPLSADRAARRFAALFLMPEASVHGTVRQLGLRPDQWSYDLLLRIKHRFGVSAEALLYRLHELALITDDRRDSLRHDLYSHYEATRWSEPDASRRILNPNGRIGDLILSARHRGLNELDDLTATLKKAGVHVCP